MTYSWARRDRQRVGAAGRLACGGEVLVSIVTAAHARARPDRVAPDVRVMIATARIFPVKVVPVPIVPSCRPLPV